MDSTNKNSNCTTQSNCPIHSPIIRRALMFAAIVLIGGAFYYWYLFTDTGSIQPVKQSVQKSRQQLQEKTMPASTRD